jgi:divalent metal cation (Fe/Co/Zn/Cd) transporter
VRKSGISFHVDLHLIVSGAISVSEGHEIAHRLKDELLNKLPEINNVLIHIEPDKAP